MPGEPLVTVSVTVAVAVVVAVCVIVRSGRAAITAATLNPHRRKDDKTYEQQPGEEPFELIDLHLSPPKGKDRILVVIKLLTEC